MLKMIQSLCFLPLVLVPLALPWWLSGKESACQCRRRVQPLGQEDPLEKEMASHSHILA